MGSETSAAPPRSHQIALLVLTACLVVAGVAGGQWFMEADYVVYGWTDKTEWTVTAGYTVGEFWGLVLQTVCLPGATVALLTSMLFFYKSPAWPSWVKVLVFLALALLLVACATVASDTMTDGLVECLWSLCQDFSSSSSSSSEAFTAFIPTVGTMYFCVLVTFACLAGVLMLRISADLLGIVTTRGFVRGLTWGVESKEESQPLIAPKAAVSGTRLRPGNSSLRSNTDPGVMSGELASFPPAFVVRLMERERRRARRAVSAVWLVGVFCFFLPAFIFASMAVGDDWEHMTVSGVKSYASSSATEEYGTKWNLRLTSTLVLKVFPDVLIYWAFAYLVAVVALVARAWDPLRRFLAAPVETRRETGKTIENGSGRLSWSHGEAFLVLTFFALLVCEGTYWYFDHGWGNNAITDKTWQERLARTSGQLANVTMGLMILPVSRNGVLEKVFGVGWEAIVAYHRRMARAFLALVLAHMVLFWVVYAQNDDFWHDWPIAIPTDYHSDNWTIPLATLTTWVMVLVMFVFSLQWVRRNWYELFYYSHHFFMVVWGVMLWHAASAWYYVAASIALWVLDHAIRVSKRLTAVSVKGLTSWGGVTRLSYTVENGGIRPSGGSQRAMLHEAGQYAFINVPAISLLEWHPFTISSCPDDEETTHHIKDMGPGTFTGKLRMLSVLGKGLTVHVDGPYGMPVEYERYRLLVMVAGGIGVTPCVSLLRHLNRLAQAGQLTHCLHKGVRLIWSTRSVEEMVMLERELQDVAGEESATSEGRFSVHLHLTGGSHREGGGSRSARTCLHHAEGRPDLPGYLARFSRDTSAVDKTNCGTLNTRTANPHEICRVRAGVQQRQQEQEKKQRLCSGALVFACGPTALVESTQRAAEEAGMDFHRETFEL